MVAKRILSLITFFLCGVLQIFSSLDPTKPLKNFIIDSWTEGITENSVLNIVQTRDGYLWMGTNEGLIWFDWI
jgi:ligand-binding sensor domain-containing protein